VNMALHKPAVQSSTYATTSGAGLAVDGNHDGDYAHGSVAMTAKNVRPWWQVDLQASYAISTITVWNRTDCCANSLSGFYILVSDTPFASSNLAPVAAQSGVSSYFVSGQAGTPTVQTVNRTGRYIRIQLTSTTYL